MEEWPGPIAHEYFQLRTLLEADQIVGAVWQLKDVAEVLIKLPAIVMARDVIAHGSDEALQADIRRTLLAKPPSLGDWHRLASDLLAKRLTSPGSGSELLLPEVAGLFRQACTKQAPTTLSDFLKELTEWRNEELGHGAFRLDIDSFRLDLQRLISTLNELLADASVAGVWNAIHFSVGSAPGEILRGHRSIRDRHERDDVQPHEMSIEPLFVVRDDRALDLSPYLSVRRCTVCHRQDVFFFNSLKTNSSNRYFFLDYLAGHQMSRPGHQEELLEREVGLLKVRGPITLPPADDVGADYLRRTTAKLLEETALEADYIAPNYLREELIQFLDSHDRGVFWLRGPAHTGKSLFIRGLVTLETQLRSRGQKEVSLPTDVAVVAYYIKREYNCFPAQLRAFLDDQLPHASVLNIGAGRRDLPSLDLQSPNPATALTVLLAQLGEISRRMGTERRVVICLDGLDELRQCDGHSIVDFIPRPEQLPEGFYLLVSSRPQADCPRWVWDEVTPRLEGNPDFVALSMNTCDPNSPYRALLRRYFDDRLAERLKQLAGDKFRWAMDGAATTEVSKIAVTSISKSKHDQLNTVWKDLLDERPGNTTQSRPALPATAAIEVVQRFNLLFDEVMERSEGLFLYVSHLVRLLADQTLGVDEVGQLPSGAKLLEHYVHGLQAMLSDKQNDLLKRVILVLAATEEANTWDYNVQPTGYADSEWRGLPLDVLAGLLDDLWADGQGLSARIVFVLYSLKEVLRTFKGDAAQHARYRLGLKEFTATVRQLWPVELRAIHKRLAEQFLLEWSGRYHELEPRDRLQLHRLRYVLAHAIESADQRLTSRVYSDTDLQVNGFETRVTDLNESADYHCATQWGTLCCVQAQHGKPIEELSIFERNNLAGAYLNRGVVRQAVNDISGAIADFSQSIELREGLRQLLAPNGQLPPEWINSLAGAYMSRGGGREAINDLSGSLADFSQSIELREGLRQLLEPDQQWPLDWRISLAGAYMGRGITRGDGNDLSGAMEDHSQSIELMEGLRQLLEPDGQWPPAWCNDLASAYMNRGNTRRSCNDLSGAMQDHSQSIELGEGLRKLLEPNGQWPPDWRDSLASAYRNRGVARFDHNDLSGALEDCSRSIVLREELRQLLEPSGQWPPAWCDNLALAYMNRGNARCVGNDLSGALDDYSHSIELMEGLRHLLEPAGKWPPDWCNDLAAAYANRGVAYSRGNDLSGAMDDCTQSIALMEGLRKLLEPEGHWPPKWRNDLANGFHNRGVFRAASNDLSGALDDYSRSIELMEGLRQMLEPKGEWRHKFQNTLDTARRNRQIAVDTVPKSGPQFPGNQQPPSIVRPSTSFSGRHSEPPLDISAVLHSVDALLKTKQYSQAVAVLQAARSNSPEIRNAEGVCRMRMGEHERAVQIFRGLVVYGVNLRTDVPLAFKTNFACALLAAGNLEGCESTLSDIKRQNETNDMVVYLRESIQRWRATLSFGDKLKMLVGVRKPVPLHFELGEIVF